MSYQAMSESDISQSKEKVFTSTGGDCMAAGDVGVVDEAPIIPSLGEKLTIYQKLAYGVGGPPMQMLSNCIGFYISIFLLSVANLNAYYNSVILLGARVYDAISDPIVGYLVSKTKTRFGRFRPWLLGAAPFGAVSFVLLFSVPQINSMFNRFIYYLFCIIILQTALTAFHVPYSSMTMVLSTYPGDRDSCSMYRMFSELLGVLIGAGVFGTIIQVYRSKSSFSAVEQNATNFNLTMKEREQFGYFLGSGVVSALFIVCALVVFFGTREYDVDIQRRENYFRSLKRIITFKPYLLLMFAFLFISLGIQAIQGNLALYVEHSLKLDSKHINFGIMTLLLVAIAFVPLVYRFSLHYSKKFTFQVGLVNIMPISLVIIFMPERPPVELFYACMIWAAPSVSVAFLMPWSMLPDVIDAFMLKTGVRREAAFYSLYVFFNKFAVGIAVGFASIVLGLSGFQEGNNQQPESVGLALRLLIGVFGVLSFLASFAFLYFYPINKQRQLEIQNQLAATRIHAIASTASMDMSTTQSCRSLIRDQDNCGDVRKLVKDYHDNAMRAMPTTNCTTVTNGDVNHNSYLNPNHHSSNGGDQDDLGVDFHIGRERLPAVAHSHSLSGQITPLVNNSRV